uniref:Solute carrier family 40 protein n=1 Tax=Haptolina brevifila TaxID=156173 RepID=A0A7S2IXN7_9EUKA
MPNSLSVLLMSDACAATCAGCVCSPLVAVIDEAITLSAAGKKDLWPAIGSKLVSIAKAPASFFFSAPFLWLWAVYAVTYASANTVESIAKALGHSPATPVLLCSTFANMGMCLLKDAAFAKMFGSSDKDTDEKKKRAGLSAKVLSIWFARDIVTQFFVFTLPLILQGKVPDLVCRLSAPVAAQYLTTPFHLLGIKLFNMPLGTTLSAACARDPDQTTSPSASPLNASPLTAPPSPHLAGQASGLRFAPSSRPPSSRGRCVSSQPSASAASSTRVCGLSSAR